MKFNLSMHKQRHHAKRSPLKDGRRKHVANAATKRRVVEGSKSVNLSKNGATAKEQLSAVGSVKRASSASIRAAPARRKRTLLDAATARIKPFVCDVCGRKYAHSFILRRHQLSHGKDRHAYKVCGQQFIRKDNLNDHVAVKHTGAKPYKCSSCSSSFALRRLLTNHTKRYHQKQQDAAMDW
ncbi:hypothetical protein AAVH_19659 [Aphelenchoides avenae]|nr:hypothetical protein AAVH_19659 [Aphelenchus avenae]